MRTLSCDWELSMLALPTGWSVAAEVMVGMRSNFLNSRKDRRSRWH